MMYTSHILRGLCTRVYGQLADMPTRRHEKSTRRQGGQVAEFWEVEVWLIQTNGAKLKLKVTNIT